MAIAAPIPEIVHPDAPDSVFARLRDKHDRAITDLRVSITDRCNYKCVYCRTGESGAQYAELSIADYLRMIREFIGLGIEKVRLTGGEPLLRKDILTLIRELRAMRTLDGDPLDIALTTNGHLLAKLAQPLRDAGLDRVSVSMDAVDPATFARITRVPGSYGKVLTGVRAAKRAGLEPVKVNCVLLRGFNDDQIVEFAKFSRDEASLCVSLNSCLWKRVVSGRQTSSFHCVKSCPASMNLCRCGRWKRTPSAKPHDATPLATVSAKSASSLPFHSRFAIIAAASG
jgi:MoaA/NifB/PqqE/SkfB family radical SAM enzyme